MADDEVGRRVRQEAAQAPARPPHAERPAEAHLAERSDLGAGIAQLARETSVEADRESMAFRPLPRDFHQDSLHAAIEVSRADVENTHQKYFRGTTIVSLGRK